MTRLLVSVRSAEEALAALAGGADIIDIKEPSRGSLGRAEESTWREVSAAVNDVPVSVALGELSELSEQSCFVPGIHFAKVGLASMRSHAGWRERWQRWATSLTPGVQPVAVAYADAARAQAPEPEEILSLAIECNVPTLLLDTFDKSGGSLLEIVSIVWLRKFTAAAREATLTVAIAGSLRAADFAKLLPLHPDILAVRTAACEGDREGKVSAALVRELRQALKEAQSPTSSPTGSSP